MNQEQKITFEQNLNELITNNNIRKGLSIGEVKLKQLKQLEEKIKEISGIMPEMDQNIQNQEPSWKKC